MAHLPGPDGDDSNSKIDNNELSKYYDAFQDKVSNVTFIDRDGVEGGINIPIFSRT